MITFQTLGLSDALLANVENLGYQAPTLIQQQAIPVLLKSKRDLVALAQTGTGKTAAFGLPLIEMCDESSRTTQALVLAPTRELCVQITSDLTAYSNNVKQLNIVAVYGGASITDQIRKLRQGCQIVVATPGRLIDLLNRNVVDLKQISYFVLDEADEMLNMGFQEDIDNILNFTASEKRVWLFSATMPPEIERIAKTYMSDPLEISVGNKNQTNENIAHQYVLISDRDRYAALKRLLDINTDIYGMVFCRTKVDTQFIADKLLGDGYNADALHGDLNQAQRDKVLNNFRNRSLQIMVATDVAARGIDVSDITHVLHFNIPDELEYYTHRSGRTARAGKTGTSIALATPKEVFRLRLIEKKSKIKFEQVAVPSGIDICHQKMLSMIHQLNTVQVNSTEIAPFLPSLNKALEELSKEDIIKRFASLEFNHFLDYYRNAPDLNIGGDRPRRDRDDVSSGSDRPEGGVKMFINLGKMDELEKMDLIRLISQASGLQRRDINRVEMKGAYSFFEVPPAGVGKVKAGFDGARFDDRPLRVDEMDRKGGDKPRDKDKDKKKDRFDKFDRNDKFDKKDTKGKKKW